MIKIFKKYNGKTRGLLNVKVGDGTLKLNVIYRASSKKGRNELKLIFNDIEEVMNENGFKLIKTKRGEK